MLLLLLLLLPLQCYLSQPGAPESQPQPGMLLLLLHQYMLAPCHTSSY
jgi:hypothetical protein